VTDSTFFPAVGGHNPVKVVSAMIPGGYTPGDRFTVAHGLLDDVGNPIAPAGAIPVPSASDADGAITVVNYQRVKMDSTNVTLRSDGAAGDAFDLIVW
jgi:hypothetical protein